MPVYPCPECGAQLRPANPVPPGKKLKCPKCETVFAPAAAAKAKPVKPAAPPKAAAPADGDDDRGSYLLANDNVTEAHEKARATAFDPIKDRFEKSARG